MKFLYNIKKFLTGKVSDEEFTQIISDEICILCPNCNTYINRQDLEDENWHCPNCNKQITK